MRVSSAEWHSTTNALRLLLVPACRCNGAWDRCLSNTGINDSFDDFASKTQATHCNFASQIDTGIFEGSLKLRAILKEQLQPVQDIIDSLLSLGSTGLPDMSQGLLQENYPLSSCASETGRTPGGIGGGKDVVCTGAATNFKCKTAT